MNTAAAYKKPVADIQTRTEIRTYKYDSHVKPRLNEVYEWVKNGYTDYSIADTLGISHESLIKYKAEILELSNVFTRARAERNNLVMGAMFSKATGVKAEVKKAKVLNNGEIIDYTEEQYIPPDVNAADLYLRNNSDEYKSAKADTGGLTLIQNNYQLPQLIEQIKQLDDKIKELDAIETTAVEAD